MRSAPSSREARTTRCRRPSLTARKASAVPRLGYWPIPNTANMSALVG